MHIGLILSHVTWEAGYAVLVCRHFAKMMSNAVVTFRKMEKQKVDPSQELLDLINEHEPVFNLFAGRAVDKNPGVIQHFLKLFQSRYPSYIYQLLKLYCRTCTLFEVKTLT